MPEKSIYEKLGIGNVDEITEKHIEQSMRMHELSNICDRRNIIQITTELLDKRPGNTKLLSTAIIALNAHIDGLDLCHQNKYDFYEIVKLYCRALLNEQQGIVDLAYSSLNDAARTMHDSWTFCAMISFLSEAKELRGESAVLYPAYMGSKSNAKLKVKFSDLEDSLDGLSEYSKKLKSRSARTAYHQHYSSLVDVLLVTKKTDVFRKVFTDVRGYLCQNRTQRVSDTKRIGFYYSCVSLLNEDDIIRASATIFLAGRVARYKEQKSDSDPDLAFQGLFNVFTVLRRRILKKDSVKVLE